MTDVRRDYGNEQSKSLRDRSAMQLHFMVVSEGENQFAESEYAQRGIPGSNGRLHHRVDAIPRQLGFRGSREADTTQTPLAKTNAFVQ